MRNRLLLITMLVTIGLALGVPLLRAESFEDLEGRIDSINALEQRTRDLEANIQDLEKSIQAVKEAQKDLRDLTERTIVTADTSGSEEEEEEDDGGIGQQEKPRH